MHIFLLIDIYLFFIVLFIHNIRPSNIMLSIHDLLGGLASRGINLFLLVSEAIRPAQYIISNTFFAVYAQHQFARLICCTKLSELLIR